MKTRPILATLCLFAATHPLPAATQPPVNPAIAGHLSDLRNMLGDCEQLVNLNYVPNGKVGKAFRDKCRETEIQLHSAQSLSDGYICISDALVSLDSRIRLYPPRRPVVVDWSWGWRMIGEAAYVDQVDRQGAARDAGLRPGDRVVTIEGIPLNRENYQQLYHLLNHLLALPGLHVEAQTRGEEPRLLAIPATLREHRRIRQSLQGNLVLLEEERTELAEKRRDDFFEVKNHVKRVGDVTIWKPLELHRDTSALNEAWRLIKDSRSLVLDLRGLLVRDHENVLHCAGFLFPRELDLGRIDKDVIDTALRIKGRPDAFTGTLLVLVDAETAGYPELLAYAVQREQRGVIVGDRTMGRMFAEKLVRKNTGNELSFHVIRLAIPTGEVVLADGTRLDGKGVIPDYQVLPKPADLAEHRDVALAKALGLLKLSVSPEEAYGLFPHFEDEDDEY